MMQQKSEIEIRKLVEADLPAVMNIDSMVHGNERLPTWPFSFEAYWSIYRPDIRLVAVIKGEVVGFVVGTIVQDEHSQSVVNLVHSAEPTDRHRWVGWLDMIGIRPEQRNKGIGRSLMETFYRECKTRNAVTRSVAYSNDDQFQSFLGSMGFKKSNIVVYEKD